MTNHTSTIDVPLTHAELTLLHRHVACIALSDATAKIRRRAIRDLENRLALALDEVAP